MAEKTKQSNPSNTWVIGVVMIILLLGGVAFYQMKLKNDLQTKLNAKEKQHKGTNGQALGSLGAEQDKGSENGQSMGS